MLALVFRDVPSVLVLVVLILAQTFSVASLNCYMGLFYQLDLKLNFRGRGYIRFTSLTDSRRRKLQFLD